MAAIKTPTYSKSHKSEICLTMIKKAGGEEECKRKQTAYLASSGYLLCFYEINSENIKKQRFSKGEVGDWQTLFSPFFMGTNRDPEGDAIWK